MDHPYQAPEADLAESVAAPRGRPFRDATVLTRCAIGLLLAGIAVSIAAIACYLAHNAILSEVVAGQRQQDDLPLPLAFSMIGVGLLQTLIMLASYIVIGMWIYRMCWNAHSLAGTRQMTVTPRWSVLWYFIPFANLWKPFAAMREIWKASVSPQDAEKGRTHPALVLWWVLWLAVGVLSWAAIRTGVSVINTQDEIDNNIAMIASDGANIVLHLVFLFVVRRLYRVQYDAQARRKALEA